MRMCHLISSLSVFLAMTGCASQKAESTAAGPTPAVKFESKESSERKPANTVKAKKAGMKKSPQTVGKTPVSRKPELEAAAPPITPAKESNLNDEILRERLIDSMLSPPAP